MLECLKIPIISNINLVKQIIQVPPPSDPSHIDNNCHHSTEPSQPPPRYEVLRRVLLVRNCREESPHYKALFIYIYIYIFSQRYNNNKYVYR
jgi:hypothetical protein